MKKESINSSLAVGKRVRVRAYGGTELLRRVIGFDSGVVRVCCEEEWQRAQRERSEPTCIGFKLSDVIAVE